MEPMPFNRTELKKCCRCHNGVMHDGAMTFYEVTFAMGVIDMTAVRQIAGMEMMLGAAAPLASVLGPTQIGSRLPAERHIFCMNCAVVPITPIELIEESPT